MSSPASSSIASTSRLPSGTSKVPAPSTSSLGTKPSFSGQISFGWIELRTMIVYLGADVRSVEKNCVNHFAPLHPALVEHHDLSSSGCHFQTKELGIHAGSRCL